MAKRAKTSRDSKSIYIISKDMETSKKMEYLVAISSFLAAVGLAFTSLLISPEHDIASGVLMMCAQFLMLTATIFGIDYKFKTHENYFRRYVNKQSDSETK